MAFRLVEKEASSATEKGEEEDAEDTETGTIIESIAEEEVEVVTSSMEEITKVYVNAEHLIVSKLAHAIIIFFCTLEPYCCIVIFYLAIISSTPIHT